MRLSIRGNRQSAQRGKPQPKAKSSTQSKRVSRGKMRKSTTHHGGTETRRKSCLIYKPLNKSLFEQGQKQQLATKDTEEKQRSQRKIWGKQVTKIRRKPQRILGIVVQKAQRKVLEILLKKNKIFY